MKNTRIPHSAIHPIFRSKNQSVKKPDKNRYNDMETIRNQINNTHVKIDYN